MKTKTTKTTNSGLKVTANVKAGSLGFNNRRQELVCDDQGRHQGRLADHAEEPRRSAFDDCLISDPTQRCVATPRAA